MTTKTSKYNGLIVGAIFTVCSFLLTFTFIVPIISAFPGVLIEAISKKILSKDPFSNVGNLTILLLTVIFLAAITLTITYTRKLALTNETLSKGKLALILLAFYFIVHPLGFYLYWGISLNFRSDGQSMFLVFYTFPFSSFAFVLLGLLIDWTRNMTTKKLYQSPRD